MGFRLSVAIGLAALLVAELPLCEQACATPGAEGGAGAAQLSHAAPPCHASGHSAPIRAGGAALATAPATGSPDAPACGARCTHLALLAPAADGSTASATAFAAPAPASAELPAPRRGRTLVLQRPLREPPRGALWLLHASFLI